MTSLSLLRPLRGRIELRNVYFRYADQTPLCSRTSISSQSPRIRNDHGTIGRWQTTLIKLMLGDRTYPGRLITVPTRR
jgi:hypothetical protein